MRIENNFYQLNKTPINFKADQTKGNFVSSDIETKAKKAAPWAGLTLGVTLGLFSRKKIASSFNKIKNFVKNGFKCVKKPAKKTNISINTPRVEEVVQNINKKISEPQFAHTKENLAEFNKERFGYIRNISKFFNKNDEASSIEFLEKFEQHYPGIKADELKREWNMLYNNVENCNSDKIFNKYLDIHKKFVPANKLNGGENANVTPMYEMLDSLENVMSKETFIKTIGELKRSANSTGDVHKISSWANGDLSYNTSKRIQEGSLTVTDIEEIKKVAKEAEEFLQPLINAG